MGWDENTGDEAGDEKPDWFKEFEEWRFNNLMRAVEEEAWSRIGPPMGFEDEGASHFNPYDYFGVNYSGPLWLFGAYSAGDPNELRNCIAACEAGGEQLAAYCRSLPDPRLRAGCWALTYAGETACIGWCYWQFGR